MFGGGFLLFITLAVLLVGPWIWQVDPQKLDIRNKDLRPIWTPSGTAAPRPHGAVPFGTDQLGPRSAGTNPVRAGARRWRWAGPQ